MGVHQATVTITSANPGVVAWTAHGLVVNTPVEFDTTGALPTAIPVQGAANSRKYVQNVDDADHFKVSSTPGGAALDCSAGTQSGTHTGFEPSGIYITDSFADKDFTATNVTFTGSSANIGWPAHGMIVGNRATFTGTPANMTDGVDYCIASVPDVDTITVSATLGDAAIVAADAGSSPTGIRVPAIKLGDQKVYLSNVPLAKKLTVDGLVTGSHVRFTQANDDTILAIVYESSGSAQMTTKYALAINIEARKVDISPFYKSWFGVATLTADTTITAAQVSEE